MPIKIVRFQAKQTGPTHNQDVSLKVQNWATRASVGDKVQLFNTNASNLTITLLLPPGLFTVDGSVTIPCNHFYEATVKAGATGKEFKYAVQAFLDTGDTFVYDPRFIIV